MKDGDQLLYLLLEVGPSDAQKLAWLMSLRVCGQERSKNTSIKKLIQVAISNELLQIPMLATKEINEKMI